LASSKNILYELIKTKPVIVFDFDGVLADSVEVKTAAFAELYKNYGASIVQLVVDHHRLHGGMSRFNKIKYYHRFFLGEELDDLEIDELAKQFSVLVVDKVIESKEVHGAMAMLEYCSRNSKQCFVNSATPLEEIQRIVDKRGLSAYFSGVYGSPQSKVDNFMQIIRQTGYETSDILYFGDAINDYEAAIRVGAGFIGLVPKDSESIFPDSTIIITDFSQLLHGLLDKN
jgi:phosphoglycolate phosphatase-like HAD superfamily hydrolase